MRERRWRSSLACRDYGFRIAFASLGFRNVPGVLGVASGSGFVEEAAPILVEQSVNALKNPAPGGRSKKCFGPEAETALTLKNAKTKETIREELLWPQN
jgi:hypothetical protein